MKEFIIIYCILAWLIGIGIVIKKWDDDYLSSILAIVIAPIIIPIRIGFLF